MYSILIVYLYCYGYTFVNLLNTDHTMNEFINENNDEYGKLIWSNESYRQSYHYYYTQLIKVNQLSPILFHAFNQSFINAISYLNVSTLFPIKYYGMEYNTVNILSKGIVGIGKSFRHSGAMKKIEVFNGMDKDGGVEIMNTNTFLAIKWMNLSISTLHDDEPEEYAIVTCIIYSNGNISIYYEKIPTEFGNNGGHLSITDGYDYATYNATGLYIIKTSYSSIKTPKTMIRSGTLVELTPNKICSEQQHCETCINASTLNEKCYWCPIVNKCSHGFDIHRPLWMLKSCYIKNTTNCQVSTTSMYTQDHDLSNIQTTEYYSNNYSLTNYATTTTTSELTTTDSLNSKMKKNGLQTNQLSSFIWNDRNLDKSGINLPLYSFILMPTGLAVLFLTLICTLWLCIYKRSKKKNKKEKNSIHINQ
ncbi:unnamed protein product [Schistosoma spindalis]|nr:unnamed protein product [Schistosoma spindale]